MSKSLKRVRAALQASGLPDDIRETDGARTAQMAAQAVGCELDQIAKSLVFLGSDSGAVFLFLTAGGNQVDAARASQLANEPLIKADAAAVRTQTGFAIGGVSPLGHINAIQTFFDPRLLEFDLIWSAAGTPNHVFPSNPAQLLQITAAQQAKFTR